LSQPRGSGISRIPTDMKIDFPSFFVEIRQRMNSPQQGAKSACAD